MEETKVDTAAKPKTINAEGITTTETTFITDRMGVASRAGSASLFKEIHILGVSDLLDYLDCEQLTELRRHFYEKQSDEKIKEPKGSAHPRFRGSKLKQDEFIIAIEDVLKTNEYEDSAGLLFDRVVERNAEEHKGVIWWEQILDEMIDFMAEKTKSRPGALVKESFCSLHTMSHCRRETIVRVVPIETATSLCFAVVSKYGKVGIYDWEMVLLEQHEVRLSTQIATTAGGEVRRTTWVTDAVYMSDAATLLVAASDRSLHFYATTGLVCVPVYHISGLPNTPTCLHYTASPTSGGASMLLVGDDHGSIATMYFQQPQYALFKRTSNNAFDKYFWKELSNQKAWIIITMDYGIHKDEITRVEYFKDNSTVVSCSNDPNTTVTIRYIVGRRAPYVFKISRGVRCFHLDRSLRLLVTGGKDSVVRLWNPIIPRKPVASLFGHKSSIVDVRILSYLNAIISISKDTVVKTWDIVSQTCMQSLPLLFPVHGTLARTPEFGVASFYPGPVSCEPTFSSSEVFDATEIILSPRTLTIASSSVLEKSKSTLTLSSGKTTSTVPSKAYSNSISVSSYATDSRGNKPDEVTRLAGSSGPSGTKMTRTMTQNTYATMKSDTSVSCTGSPWTRMELLAVCCNYIVILQLSERELHEGESKRVGHPLDPPLRNQDPAAPSPWLTVDSSLQTGFADESQQPQLPRGENDVPFVPANVLMTLQRSLGNDITQELTSLAAACSNQDSHKADLKQIRGLVEQCAPHLALGIVDVVDLVFTPPGNVPASRGRRRKVEESRGKGTRLTMTSTAADESSTSQSVHETTTTTNSSSTTNSNIK